MKATTSLICMSLSLLSSMTLCEALKKARIDIDLVDGIEAING